MSTVFIGDCTYKEVAGAELDVDPWGMDRLVRHIEGRVDQLPTYLATLKRRRDIKDSIYPDLVMVNYHIAMGRATAKADLYFGGILGGSGANGIPEPVPKFGMHRESVTIPFIGDVLGQTNGISATFEYEAPTATYLYSTREKPTALKYRGKLDVTKETLQIISRTGAAGAWIIFRGRTFKSPGASKIGGLIINGTANAYNMVAQVFTDSWDYEQVGQWWQCREVNVAVLQPLDLANAGFVYQI
jgi:hypothetical protein